MTSPNGLNCDDVQMADLIARYVSGAAADEEAEALERHVLTCSDCAADLQSAVEVRAAWGRSPRASQQEGGAESHPVAAPASKGGLLSRRFLLVAAAVLAVVAGSFWYVKAPAGESELSRGNSALAIVARWESNGALRIDWAVAAGAMSYRVRVIGESGGEVSREVEQPPVLLQASEVRSLDTGSISIRARNAAGEVVAESKGPLPRR